MSRRSAPVRGARGLRPSAQRRPAPAYLGGGEGEGVARAAPAPAPRRAPDRAETLGLPASGQVGRHRDVIGSAAGMALRHQTALQRPCQRRQVGQPRPPSRPVRRRAKAPCARPSRRAPVTSRRNRVMSAPCSRAIRSPAAVGPTSAGRGARSAGRPACRPRPMRPGLRPGRALSVSAAPPARPPPRRRQRGKIGQGRVAWPTAPPAFAPCPPAREGDGSGDPQRPAGIVQAGMAQVPRRGGEQVGFRAGQAQPLGGLAASVAAPAWPVAPSPAPQPRPGCPSSPSSCSERWLAPARRGFPCRCASSATRLPGQVRPRPHQMGMGGMSNVTPPCRSNLACRRLGAQRARRHREFQAGGIPLPSSEAIASMAPRSGSPPIARPPRARFRSPHLCPQTRCRRSGHRPGSCPARPAGAAAAAASPDCSEARRALPSTDSTAATPGHRRTQTQAGRRIAAPDREFGPATRQRPAWLSRTAAGSALRRRGRQARPSPRCRRPQGRYAPHRGRAGAAVTSGPWHPAPSATRPRRRAVRSGQTAMPQEKCRPDPPASLARRSPGRQGVRPGGGPGRCSARPPPPPPPTQRAEPSCPRAPRRCAGS